jgi:hypothetical protein
MEERIGTLEKEYWIIFRLVMKYLCDCRRENFVWFQGFYAMMVIWKKIPTPDSWNNVWRIWRQNFFDYRDCVRRNLKSFRDPELRQFLLEQKK